MNNRIQLCKPFVAMIFSQNLIISLAALLADCLVANIEEFNKTATENHPFLLQFSHEFQPPTNLQELHPSEMSPLVGPTCDLFGKATLES